MQFFSLEGAMLMLFNS